METVREHLDLAIPDVKISLAFLREPVHLPLHDHPSFPFLSQFELYFCHLLNCLTHPLPSPLVLGEGI